MTDLAQAINQIEQAILDNGKELKPALKQALSDRDYQDLITPRSVEYKPTYYRISISYRDFIAWYTASDDVPEQVNSIEDMTKFIPRFRADRDAYLAPRGPGSVAAQLDEILKWSPGQLLMLQFQLMHYGITHTVTIKPNFYSK